MSPDEILERAQWQSFWMPSGTKVVDTPQLRFTAHAYDAMYLNTVSRTRAGPRSYDDLIDEVLGAHRGVSSRWLVLPGSEDPLLRQRLVAHGYKELSPSYGYFANVDDLQGLVDNGDTHANGLEIRRVDNEQRFRDWHAVVGQAFELPIPIEPALFQHQLAVCAPSDSRYQRFVAYDSAGAPVSAGDVLFTPELGFGYLMTGSTVPEFRGRGAYSALLVHRVRLAQSRGIGALGAFAIADTSAPLLQRHGFARQGLASFFVRPPV